MNLNLPFVRTVAKKEITISITPIGEEKAQKFQSTGLEFRALAVIHDEGPTSMKDLGTRLNIEHEKAVMVANLLIRKGWATRGS